MSDIKLQLFMILQSLVLVNIFSHLLCDLRSITVTQGNIFIIGHDTAVASVQLLVLILCCMSSLLALPPWYCFSRVVDILL